MSAEDNDATKTLRIDSDTLKMEKDKAKDQPACVIIVRGKPQGKRYNLTKPSMIMGRDVSAEIVIDDANVSRKHAEFLVQADEIQLRDNGSTNGTFVNDKKIEGVVTLKKEDMVKIGNTILKYLPKGELEINYIGALESAAHTDALTKVFNKGHIMEVLEAEFKRAKALQQEFSLIILDLDHFKKINDTHGHDAGDMVLRESCALVRNRILPKSAVMGRFGGEEFLIVLPNTGLEDAMAIGENVRSALEKNAFNYEGKRIPVTSSVGVAEMAVDVDSSQAIFKLADKAVYSAKQSGRNKVCKA